MAVHDDSTQKKVDLSLQNAIDQLCDEFEASWRRGEKPDISAFLQRANLDLSPTLFIELVQIDMEYRANIGHSLKSEEYAECFRRCESTMSRTETTAVLLKDQCVQRRSVEKVWLIQGANAEVCDVTEKGCVSPQSAEISTSGMAMTAPCDKPDAGRKPDSHSASIGRYRTELVLGRGAFGIVYLGYDDQLARKVAIKVPHPHMVARSEVSALYLKEARTAASLDHPHIVTIYDVGATSEIPCYIVSQYINGSDLASRIRQSRLTQTDACMIVATVAEALHYAHKRRLVHRDVKPGNVLLDEFGTPYISDFGLALRDQDSDQQPCYIGTPAYMSPEQARGEGHRVDGRSDVFSLGIVLYELIAGCRPFAGRSDGELRTRIASFDPRPPRQIDDSIPQELERICLKALSKRAVERYPTAQDLADDLRQCFASNANVKSRPPD